jgi:hypothetical protein
MKNSPFSILVFSLIFFSGGTFAADSQSCNRECLHDMMRGYLEAVVTNNPSSVPLLPGFRQTDNAVVKRPGTGVWNSVTSIGNVERYYLDPESNQAAFLGIVNEEDQPAIVTVRIKVIDRQISEAEWYIARADSPGMMGPPTLDGTVRAAPYNAEYLTNNPPPEDRNIPLQSRLSRTSLVGIANSYFDGLTSHDGSVVLAHPDCYRVENGVLLTGRQLPEGSTDGFEGRTNCTSSFQIGGPFNIAVVAARRYPVVDEVQQVVMGDVVFRRFANAPQRRLGLSELFYIDGELISSIQAAMFYADPNIPLPNWPPYDGNFPLPTTFGNTR